MMKFRKPAHPVIVKTAVLLGSGLVAALLCSKAYASELNIAAPVAPAAKPVAAPAAKFDPRSNPVLALIGANIGRPVAAESVQTVEAAGPVLTGRQPEMAAVVYAATIDGGSIRIR